MISVDRDRGIAVFWLYPMLRLVSLICLFLIALLRLVGGATNTQIIQIHDDLFFDSRADVAQEALNTACGAASIPPDLGAREQNAASAIHLEGEALSSISLLTTCNTCSLRIHPARVDIRRTQNQEDESKSPSQVRQLDISCSEPDA